MADADPQRFLGELDSVPYADLKDRLNRSWSQEGGLSYARRRLHVTMDLLRSELERRTTDDQNEELIDRLGNILGGGPSRPAGSRGARPRPPSAEAQAAADERIDNLVPQGYLARLPDLDTEQIETLVGRLVQEEQAVSEERRKIHSIIDDLEAELARRYKAGLASPDELLRRGGGGDD